MNSKSSPTYDPYKLILKLADKIYNERSDKYVALWNPSIYYTCRNIKNSYKKHKFKISAPLWNDKFELSGELYSVLDTQGYFECIIKKHEAVTDNASMRMYINKIKRTLKLN